MKVRLKDTDEIINVASYATITLDKCNSSGDPIEVGLDKIELLEEKSSDIDWEQRRYELTSSLINTMVGSCKDALNSTLNMKYISDTAVKYADTIINLLQNELYGC